MTYTFRFTKLFKMLQLNSNLTDVQQTKYVILF